nr:unknown [Picea sitchensis]
MITAATEERYVDAAQWRDELNQLRSKRSDRTKQK